MAKKPLFDYKTLISNVLKEEGIKETKLSTSERVLNGLSSGSYALDLIIGGKLAGGFRSNIFGKEGGGKSTVVFNMVRDALNKGINVILFDAENAMEGNRLTNAGVNVKDPNLTYVDDIPAGEIIYEIIRKILEQMPDDTEKKQPKLAIVLDSIAALVPKAKLKTTLEVKAKAGTKKEAKDKLKGEQMALEAKMHKGISLYKNLLKMKNVMFLDTNHLKMNPGAKFGNPEYEPGGATPKHLSEVRMKMTKLSKASVKTGVWKDTEDCWDGIGIDRYTYSKILTTKNKLFSPYRECYVRFCFETKGKPGYGFDPAFDAFEYLRLTGQANYKGGWINFLQGPFEVMNKMRWKEFKVNVFKEDQKPLVRVKGKKTIYSYYKALDLLEDDSDIEKLDKEYGNVIFRLKDAISQYNFKSIIEAQMEDGSAFNYLFDTQGEVSKIIPEKEEFSAPEPIPYDGGSFSPNTN